MTIYFRDDEWRKEWIDFFEKNNTVLPVKGVPYSIRKVEKNKDGLFGLYLNEIQNTPKDIPFPYYKFSLDPVCELNNTIDWELINDFYKHQ